jgi:hypothetical protein
VTTSRLISRQKQEPGGHGFYIFVGEELARHAAIGRD